MGKFKDNEAAYSEQVRSMRSDGKTYADIKTFFSEKYDIKLYDTQISAIMKGVKIPKSIQRRKRKVKKLAGQEVQGECTYGDICKFSEICRPDICKFKGD